MVISCSELLTFAIADALHAGETSSQQNNPRSLLLVDREYLERALSGRCYLCHYHRVKTHVTVGVRTW